MKRLFAISFLLFFIAFNGSPVALATGPSAAQVQKTVDSLKRAMTPGTPEYEEADRVYKEDQAAQKAASDASRTPQEVAAQEAKARRDAEAAAAAAKTATPAAPAAGSAATPPAAGAAGSTAAAPAAPASPEDRVNTLFPPGSVGDQGALPTGDLKKNIVPAAIRIALALAGTAFFCALVYSGVMLVIAQGNEEELTKFKNMLIWSLVGLAFITASYALVRGVMTLVFK